MLETEGITALLNDIRRMEDMFDRSDAAPREEVRSLLVNAGEKIEEEMHNILNNDVEMPNTRTGKLNAAIHTGKVKRRATKGHYVSIGVHRQDWSEDDDYYPAYVEFGHAGPRPAPPHPYIRTAYDRRKDESYNIIREGLGELIDSYIKK